MAKAPRQIAGKYEVRGVLGEGGTGIVYDAVRVEDGTPVALKVMHAHFAGDAQIRGRFQREAAILRRLQGPHVCPILDFGEAEGEEPGKNLVYLALPRIDGPSLEHVLQERTLDVERVTDIMVQVCAALRSAHAQGIIHRDLKPANVILERGDDGGARENVIVVDFGMSKIVTGSGPGTTSLTAHNMLFGTPEYMSPEQARGDDIDARCDVYAAGVMLYEMLTGTPPFTGATPLVVLTAHLTSDLEPPSSRATPGRVTPALESVVVHALARERDQRYPTAAALSAALLHARAAPDDVASLRPEAFTTSPMGTEAFARTLPGAAPSGPPHTVVLADDGASPVSATIPSGAPLPVASRHAAPPEAPAVAPPAPDASARTWVLLWVVAAAASIGIGIYLALR